QTGKADAATGETSKAEAGKIDSAKNETSEADAAKSQPSKAEAGEADTAKSESTKAEPDAAEGALRAPAPTAEALDSGALIEVAAPSGGAKSAPPPTPRAGAASA